MSSFFSVRWRSESSKKEVSSVFVNLRGLRKLHVSVKVAVILGITHGDVCGEG